MERKFYSANILGENTLTPDVLVWFSEIQDILVSKNILGFLKGGVLRDYISNLYNGTKLSPKDLDIMITNGVNIAVGELLKKGASINQRRNRRRTPVFELSLPTKNGEVNADIGIILGRANSYQRHQNTIDLINDDSRLSDFTVNALFLPLDEPLDVTNIIDPLGGIDDINNRQVRMVAANTFVRNPECMLRAVRIADRLSATIEPNTFKAIKHYAHLILMAPKPVVDQNLEVIFQSQNRNQNLHILEASGLLKHINLDQLKL